MALKPTISVVIPCYNEEKNIPSCLEAILNQTEMPEEVIFVNNNSTDNSRAVAEGFTPRFQQKSINFKIIDVAEKGIVPARKVGFKAVKSDLIGGIDADIVLNENWVRFAKCYFEKNQETAALGGPIYYKNGSIRSKIHLFFLFWNYRLFPGFSLWGGNNVFWRKSFEEIGGFDGYGLFAQKLNLIYPYEDSYLSESFSKVGKVRFRFGLSASALGVGVGMARDFRQTIDYWRIKYYFWKNK